ncbi:hypothetical protein GCM10023317_72800 [Actinopolymorpha pittospori]|uniref:Superoxide dismutase n=1 Tax=Actinopolymorpha pittospori TaxID=648752 RepID=A0A927MNA4_9ACTN|nr:Fe-Mn family superoxide dismutase [Actinopolymorpha pittospori]
MTGANAALEQLADARTNDALTPVNLYEKNLAFNLAGHVSHSVFWPNMSPDGGDRPNLELGAAIEEYFGSFDGFRAHFTATATSLQGSGWSILAWDSLGQRLIIEQLYDHQGNLLPARFRCSCSTCGSTPTTCSTATPRPITSPPGGRSPTGPTSRRASRQRAPERRD